MLELKQKDPKIDAKSLALFPGDSCYPISPKYKNNE
jgi:hypothetical protein